MIQVHIAGEEIDTLNSANCRDLVYMKGNSSCAMTFWISHASSLVIRAMDSRVG